MFVNLSMKNTKQVTFNITQSRRIKNYAQKNKLTEKEVLAKFPKAMHLIFQAWKKTYANTEEVSFRKFFLEVMKFAEFESRLKERQDDLKKVTEHVEILKEALDEYESDYNTVTKIEQIVKDLAGGVM